MSFQTFLIETHVTMNFDFESTVHYSILSLFLLEQFKITYFLWKLIKTQSLLKVDLRRLFQYIVKIMNVMLAGWPIDSKLFRVVPYESKIIHLKANICQESLLIHHCGLKFISINSDICIFQLLTKPITWQLAKKAGKSTWKK